MSSSVINNNPLAWKYAPLDKVGTSVIDISGLNFNELCVHVDINQSGNRCEFILPKNVIQSSGWYRGGGFHNTTNDYQLVVIYANATSVSLSSAYLNGQTYTNNTRVQIYYR